LQAPIDPARPTLPWTPPLSWLPRQLLVPDNPGKAIAVGWALAFPASILFAALIQLVAPDARSPAFPPDMGPAQTIGALVAISPIVESLIMGTVLLVLLRFLRPARAVIASAVGWGIAHSLAAPIWGLVIWWPFLIFSTLFVVWRERSLWLAFAMPMIVHGLQNLLPALLLAAGRA
jgi:hypothetical protein